MSVKKICGIETEYGIFHKSSNPLNPIASSSILLNSYISKAARNSSAQWNFEDETPGMDLRGHNSTGSMGSMSSLHPEVDTQMINAVLTNGARYYVDHAHPEFSSPECADVMSVLIYDQAGDEILRRSMKMVMEELPAGEEIIIYKNNSDGKGNSYGCHENYLLSRSTPFQSIITGATAHFVTRQIYTGAGKLGSEMPEGGSVNGSFQISQRADFIEEEVGLETTLKRPIINTRDEPHSFAEKYRRFHVIVGDANISQVSTFLKLGTTAIVLEMLEEECLPPDFIFENPVEAVHLVSQDLDLNKPLNLANGNKATALEIQWELLNYAKKYADAEGLENVGGEVGYKVLELWEEVLGDLEVAPMSLANRLDWVAKYQLLQNYKERHNLEWGDARLAALGLQYHDLREAHSIASRLNLKQLVSPEDVEQAIFNPPDETRAYFRGECLKKFPQNIVAVNWDSIVFNLGEDSLKRLPMMEPTKGTKLQLEDLLESSNSLQELLKKLDT